MDMERELLKGNTPSLVMAVLRDGPLHGYAIAREIERRSGQALRFKEGTLYPALHALERQGYVVGEWRSGDGKRGRKEYTLTPAGHSALDARSRAWSSFAAAIDGVLKGDSDGPTRSPAGRARPGAPSLESAG